MISILKNSLVRRAEAYARVQHKGQKRLTGEPYIIHPTAVARIVAGFTNDTSVVAAAYLHDVIEDTGSDYEDLKERFGSRVADYVSLLSRDFRKPKKESLKEYRRQIAEGPAEVKLIAAADMLHNLASPAGKGFMKRYRKKVAATIPYIRRGNLGKYKKAITLLLSGAQALISEA